MTRTSGMPSMKKTAKSSTPVRRNKTGPQQEHAAFFETLRGLAEQIQALNQQDVIEYTPVVESTIRSRDRDIQCPSVRVRSPAFAS